MSNKLCPHDTILKQLESTSETAGYALDRGIDYSGQVIFYTGIYQWKDGSLHDEYEQEEKTCSLAPTLDQLEESFRATNSYSCPDCGKRGGH